MIRGSDPIDSNVEKATIPDANFESPPNCSEKIVVAAAIGIPIRRISMVSDISGGDSQKNIANARAGITSSLTAVIM